MFASRLTTTDELLKPGMYADLKIEHDMGTGLLIPESAVLRTGERAIAFRLLPGNRFEPVELKLGGRFGDNFEVNSRTEGRRRRRRLRRISDRLGVPPQSNDIWHRGRSQAWRLVEVPMIERIIEFCARNKFLVLIFTAVAVAAAVHLMRQMPLDAIPDLSDTQVIIYSRWDRSPDIVEDQVTYPIVTALLGAPEDQSRSRLFRFRLLLCLCHLPGRHRYLLGTKSNDRIPFQNLATAARRSAHRAWAGRHERWLGLSICFGR